MLRALRYCRRRHFLLRACSTVTELLPDYNVETVERYARRIATEQSNEATEGTTLLHELCGRAQRLLDAFDACRHLDTLCSEAGDDKEILVRYSLDTFSPIATLFFAAPG